jgi:hypothetical protein
LIDTVTLSVAPAASVPPADDSVTHVCVFDAVQLIEVPPVFVNVYCWLDGLNGPPGAPEEDMPPAGVTDIAPAAAFTVMLTVAVLPSAVPSLALYVKLSGPLYPAVGVYVKEPLAFSVTVPWAGSVTFTAVSESPFVSVSLPRTPGAPTFRAVFTGVL